MTWGNNIGSKDSEGSVRIAIDVNLTGQPPSYEELSKKLDEKSLLSLVRDILSHRGHSAIRVTDGPGDGKRDLHSISPEGDKCISQCKFHQDARKTCSSAELGELALAMVKFGSKTGIFITNAKISPQAKREFLSDYPGLVLDFLDGVELYAVINASLLLRSMWLDGVSFSRVNCHFSMPFLVRDLGSGKPLGSDLGTWAAGIIHALDEEYATATFEIKFEGVDQGVLEPYAAPEVPTSAESGLLWLNVPVLKARGNISIADVPRIRELAASAYSSNLSGKPSEELFAIRFGTPELLPLEGHSAGEKITLAVEPATLLVGSSSIATEGSWYSLVPGDRWSVRSDARVSEMDDVRIYNLAHDFLANYRLETPLSGDQLKMNLLAEDARHREWQSSLFLRGPEIELEAFATSAVCQPDDKLDFFEETQIWAWFAPSMNSIIQQQFERYDSRDFRSNIGPRYADSVQRFLRVMAAAQGMEGLEVIPPEKARHCVGAVQSDPLSTARSRVWSTAELLAYGLGSVSSPVCLKKRKFEAHIAWALSGRTGSRFSDPEELNADFKSRLLGVPELSTSLVSMSAELLENECFVICSLVYRLGPQTFALSTTELFGLLEEAVVKLIQVAEEVMTMDGLDYARDTRRFWFVKTGVTHNPDQSTPPKVYHRGCDELGEYEVLVPHFELEAGFVPELRRKQIEPDRCIVRSPDD